MHIVAIIAIAICLIAIAYRDFKIAMIALGVIALAAVGFYFLSPKDHSDNQLLETVSLGQTTVSIGYAKGFVLDARIQNDDSNKTIQSVLIRSSLKNCNADQSECLTIGEEDNLVKTRIPPKQARDTRINLSIKQLNPVQGMSVWTHEIVGVN